MKLIDLATRTGLSLRMLRYVVDHEIVSRRQLAQDGTTGQGRGVRREFSEFSGFTVSLAAAMLVAGLTRQLTKTVLQALFRWVSESMKFEHGEGIASFVLFARARSIVLEVADATFMRVELLPDAVGGASVNKLEAVDWTDITTGKPAPAEYSPLISVRLGLGPLADKLRARQG